jgi:hypothetical protein
MASILDLGLLEYFLPWFIFIFVLIIVWALLEKVEFFGKNKLVNWVIAFCIALMFIIVPEMQTIVATITPFFMILIIFLILVFIVFMFMGYSGDKILEVISQNEIITWVVIILALGIMGLALTQVYGDAIHEITSPEQDGDDLEQSIGEIIFHPKVLGVSFILILAALVVKFVSSKTPGV